MDKNFLSSLRLLNLLNLMMLGLLSGDIKDKPKSKKKSHHKIKDWKKLKVHVSDAELNTALRKGSKKLHWTQLEKNKHILEAAAKKMVKTKALQKRKAAVRA